MNFLVDANLPRRLVDVFRERGHRADHPEKLLLVSTGNIINKDLEMLLAANFDQIISDLTSNRFVELTREHVVVHA